jgi:hypothetical protein
MYLRHWLAVVCAGAAATAVLGQACEQSTYVVNPYVSFSWLPPSPTDTSITITFTFNNIGGWLCFGILEVANGAMSGMDCWLMTWNNTGQLSDTVFVGHSNPTVDVSQDTVLLSSYQTGGSTVYVIRRALVTSDSDDNPFNLTGTTPLSIAWGAKSTIGYHKTNRTNLVLDFLAPYAACSPSPSPTPAVTVTPSPSFVPAPASCSASTYVLNPYVSFSWLPPSPTDTSITITFTFNNIGGWLCFGILEVANGAMSGMDCWLMTWNNSGQLSDTVFVGHSNPTVDTSQDTVLLSSYQTGGSTVYVIRRALVTSDSDDNPFNLTGTTPLSIAWGAKSTIGYHKTNRTNLVLDFLAPYAACSPSPTPSRLPTPSPSFVPAPASCSASTYVLNPYVSFSWLPPSPTDTSITITFTFNNIGGWLCFGILEVANGAMSGMDCWLMTWNNTGQLSDTVFVGHSNPTVDTSQDTVLLSSYQTGGSTVYVIRRALVTSDSDDNPFNLTGTTPLSIAWGAKSTIGYHKTNRTNLVLDFLAPYAACSPSPSPTPAVTVTPSPSFVPAPASCSASTYVLNPYVSFSWLPPSPTDTSITITFTFNNIGGWLCFGILEAANGAMSGMDCWLMTWNNTGQLSDTVFVGHSNPTVDTSQDTVLLSSYQTGGSTVYVIRRALVTSDSDDNPFNLTGTTPLSIAWGAKSTIGYHKTNRTNLVLDFLAPYAACSPSPTPSRLPTPSPSFVPAPASCSASTYVLNPYVSFSWLPPSPTDTSITITFTFNNIGGWLCFGILEVANGAMSGMDCWLMTWNNTGQLSDTVFVGHSNPTVDTSQDTVLLSSYQTGGSTVYVIRRALVTSDSDDNPFNLTGTTPLSIAWGAKSTVGYHKTNRTNLVLDFLAPYAACSPSPSPTPAVTVTPSPSFVPAPASCAASTYVLNPYVSFSWLPPSPTDTSITITFTFNNIGGWLCFGILEVANGAMSGMDCWLMTWNNTGQLSDTVFVGHSNPTVDVSQDTVLLSSYQTGGSTVYVIRRALVTSDSDDNPFNLTGTTPLSIAWGAKSTIGYHKTNRTNLVLDFLAPYAACSPSPSPTPAVTVTPSPSFVPAPASCSASTYVLNPYVSFSWLPPSPTDTSITITFTFNNIGGWLCFGILEVANGAMSGMDCWLMTWNNTGQLSDTVFVGHSNPTVDTSQDTVLLSSYQTGGSTVYVIRRALVTSDSDDNPFNLTGTTPLSIAWGAKSTIGYHKTNRTNLVLDFLAPYAACSPSPSPTPAVTVTPSPSFVPAPASCSASTYVLNPYVSFSWLPPSPTDTSITITFTFNNIGGWLCFGILEVANGAMSGMDCWLMTWNNTGQLSDTVFVGHSNPTVDTSQDTVLLSSYQTGGSTVYVIRRALVTSDSDDNPFNLTGTTPLSIAWGAKSTIGYHKTNRTNLVLDFLAPYAACSPSPTPSRLPTPSPSFVPAPASCSASTYVLNPYVSFSWLPPSPTDTSITITFTFNNIGGWLCFGILEVANGAMSGMDCWLMTWNNTGQLSDTVFVGHSNPTVDTNQDTVLLSSYQTGGSTVYVIRRALVTSDSDDNPFNLTGTTPLSIAWGAKSTIGYHKTNRTNLVLDFLAPYAACSPSPSPTPAVTVTPSPSFVPAPASCSASTYVLNPYVSFSWLPPSPTDTSITITFTFNNIGGWLCFGILEVANGAMSGMDCWLMTWNNTGQLSDTVFVGHSNPTVDVSQDTVLLSSYQTGGSTVYVIRRALVTSDSDDNPFNLTGTTPLSIAWGAKSTIGYHKTNRTNLVLDFLAPYAACSPSPTPSRLPTPSPSFVPAPASCSASTYVLNPYVSFSWLPPSPTDTSITITFTFNNIGGWLCFGILEVANGAMSGMDCWLMTWNNTGQLSDTVFVGHSNPTVDVSQDTVLLSSYQTGGSTVYVIRRALVTSDSDDNPFNLTGTTPLSIAWGAKSTIGYHKTNRTNLVLDFLAPYAACSPSPSPTPAVTVTPSPSFVPAPASCSASTYVLNPYVSFSWLPPSPTDTSITITFTFNNIGGWLCFGILEVANGAMSGMDCWLMTWNNTGQLSDTVFVGHSNPTVDTSQDTVLLSSYQTGGSTVYVIRRALVTSDSDDNPFNLTGTTPLSIAWGAKSTIGYHKTNRTNLVLDFLAPYAACSPSPTPSRLPTPSPSFVPAPASCSASTYVLNPYVSFSWLPPSPTDTSITITFTFNNIGGWLCFGILEVANGAMSGMDCWLMTWNNTGQLSDTVFVGHSNPTVDTNQDTVLLSSYQTGGSTVYVIRRALVTSDSDDNPFNLTGTTPLSIAWGAKSTIGYHKTNRTNLVLDFLAPYAACSPSPSPTPAVTVTPSPSFVPAPASCSASTYVLNPYVSFSWLPPSPTDTSITITFTFNNIGGWLCFGILEVANGAMSGMDCWLMTWNNTGQLSDTVFVGHSNPTVDVSQDTVLLSSYQTGGSTVYVIRRALVTSDSDDNPFNLTGTTPLSIAWGAKSTIGYHKTNRTNLVLDFLAPYAACSPSPTPSRLPTPSPSFVPAPASCSASTYVLNPYVSFSWLPPSPTDTSITITFTFNNIGGWLCFGILELANGAMSGMDCWLMTWNNTGQLSDTVFVGHSNPTVDTSQDTVLLSSYQTGGSTVYVIRRALVTSDSDDNPFNLTGTTPLSIAWGAKSTIGYHKTNRTNLVLDFLAPYAACSPSPPPTPAVTVTPSPSFVPAPASCSASTYVLNPYVSFSWLPPSPTDTSITITFTFNNIGGWLCFGILEVANGAMSGMDCWLMTWNNTGQLSDTVFVGHSNPTVDTSQDTVLLSSYQTGGSTVYVIRRALVTSDSDDNPFNLTGTTPLSIAWGAKSTIGYHKTNRTNLALDFLAPYAACSPSPSPSLPAVSRSATQTMASSSRSMFPAFAESVTASPTRIPASTGTPTATKSRSPSGTASAGATPSPTSAPAAPPSLAQRQRSLVLNDVIKLEWLVPLSTDVGLTITVTFAATNGWLSFGIRSDEGMARSDVCVIQTYSNGDITVSDGYIEGYDAPVSDGQQDLQVLSSSQTNGNTVVQMYRLLNTGDGNDYPIVRDSETPMLYAWDTESAEVGYHGDNRLVNTIAFFTLNAITVYSPSPTVSPPVTPSRAATVTSSKTAAASLAAGASPSSTFSGRQRQVTLNTYLTLDWLAPLVPDTDINITFTYAATFGWFSFGVRTAFGMAGSDMWVVQIYDSGKVNLTDTKSTGYTKPIIDAHQDLVLVSASQSAGSTTVTINRKLVTGDTDDVDITRSTVTPVIYAWSTTKSDVISHGSSRGVSNVDFFALSFPTGFSPSPAETPAASESMASTITASKSAMPTIAEGASPSATFTGRQRETTINQYLSLNWLAPLQGTGRRLIDHTGDTDINITFTFSCEAGWFSMGIRTAFGMAGADMWIVQVFGPGNVLVTDTISPDYDMPRTDARQDVTLISSTQTDDGHVITLNRKLVTQDSDDVDITAGSVPLAFAWDTTNATVTYHRNNRMTTSVDFFALTLLKAYSPSPSGTPEQSRLAPTPTASPVFDSQTDGRNRAVTISSALQLKWIAPLDIDTYINVTMIFAGTNGYFCLGIRGGTSMINVDSWTVQVFSSGTVIVTDGMITSYSKPDLDYAQDLKYFDVVRATGSTTITLQRKLVTGDPDDLDIVRGAATPVTFAWSTSDPNLGYHGQNRLIGSLDFFATGDVAGGGFSGNGDVDMAGDPDLIKRYSFHAMVLSGVWGMIIPAGVFATRFYAHKHAATLLHKWGSTTALTLTLPAAGQAMLSGSGDAPNLRTYTHQKLGEAITYLMVIQAVMGFASNHFVRSKVAPPIWWRKFIWLHHFLGYLLLLIAFANLVLGLRLYLGYAYMFMSCSFFALVIVGGVAAHRVIRHVRAAGHEHDKEGLIHTSALVGMSMAELRHGISTGRKLIVWNGLVLDVGEFAQNHPGGTYLIEANLGEDITAWFRGHESNDATIKSHAHSKVAKEICLEMIVGALRIGDESRVHKMAEHSWGDLAIQGADGLDDSSGLLWKLESKTNVIHNSKKLPVVRLEFSAPHASSCDAAMWSLASFGRYMVVHVSLEELSHYLDENEEEANLAALNNPKRNFSLRMITLKLKSFRSSAKIAPLPQPAIPSTATAPDTQASQAGSLFMSPHVPVATGGSTMLISPMLTPAASALAIISPTPARTPRAKKSRSVPRLQHPIGTPNPNDASGRLSLGPASPRPDTSTVGAATPRPDTSTPLPEGGSVNTGVSDTTDSKSIGSKKSSFRSIRSRNSLRLPGMLRKNSKSSFRKVRGARHRSRSRTSTASTSLGADVPQVQRPYTMVRRDGDDGLVLYIRRYPVGTVSRFLCDLPVGSKVTMTGPCGLGLRIDPLSKGGVVVVVVQGSCIASVFDLIQHIWKRYVDRLKNSPYPADHLLALDLQAEFPGWTTGSGDDDSSSSGGSNCDSPKMGAEVMEELEDQPLVMNADPMADESLLYSPVAGTALSPISAGNKTDYRTAGTVSLAAEPRGKRGGKPAEDSRRVLPHLPSAASVSHSRTSAVNTSAAHTIINAQPMIKLTLIACFECEDDVIERKVLTWLHCNCPDISIQFNVKRMAPVVASSENPDGTPAVTTGRLNAQRLLGILPKTDLVSVCCCGAPTFVQTVRVAYMSRGLPRSMFTVIA